MMTNIGLDIVNVFLSIFNEDVGTINRKNKEGYQQMDVQIRVHSNNINKWNECKPLIEKLVNFVTESDYRKWNVNFIKDDNIKLNLQSVGKEIEFEEVSLLSGGLDSFCGHYTNIKEKRKTMYLGYSTSNMDSKYITAVYNMDSMKEATKLRVPKLHVNKVNYDQRSRSLLFFSLAVYYAIEVNAKNINIYENGVMTLNPGFNLRGTTKTTHPKTVYLFKEILKVLNINIDFRHPFLFKTKGDLVNHLDQTFLNEIKNTRSCSKTPQWIGIKGKNACGVCAPCMLRKISLAYHDLERYDDNIYVVPYNGRMDQVDKDLVALYDQEYNSTIRYYEQFLKSIRNISIFNNLDLREGYYKNIKDIDPTNYLTLTKSMLDGFAEEIEKFLKKYT